MTKVPVEKVTALGMLQKTITSVLGDSLDLGMDPARRVSAQPQWQPGKGNILSEAETCNGNGLISCLGNTHIWMHCFLFPLCNGPQVGW